MSKLYQLCGYFLVGISLFGGLGYAIHCIPKLLEWAIYLLAISVLTVLILVITKDLIVDILEIPDYQYIGWLILGVFMMIVGISIQMR